MSVPYVEPIPEGWEMRLDETTQTYYFIDHMNQRTQWQHPITNLIYRPTEVMFRGGLNGFGSTPISVNRQPATKQSLVQDYHTQFNSTSASEQKTTIPMSKSAGEPEKALAEPIVPKKSDEDLDRISRVLDKAKPITDESLDVLILELDGIGVDGSDEVRTSRRNAVKQLQQVIEMLEFRGSVNSGDIKQSSGSDDAKQSAAVPPSEEKEEGDSA
ncbi:unnamed protein product [Hymenolepis diminuta]|uniref:WW domain-containing protein n=1 Tax=Hymenolepis diminuta TaxID=6216 RepID=A0A0R3STN1_HYMDI|nr:unnamed protein product [Hymenolepis diminuta]